MWKGKTGVLRPALRIAAGRRHGCAVAVRCAGRE